MHFGFNNDILKIIKELGSTSQRVLLLLGAGLALGLSGSPSRYFKIIESTGKAWKDIEKRALHRAIKNLYQSKLINIEEKDDETIILILSEKGEEKILKYKLAEMKIQQMKKWDQRWRMVVFDIPESKKKIRDALRFHLKNLKFFEFQKSIFIHPFECKNEIDFLIEFYNIRPYVRFIIAEDIDNQLHLKKYFELL